MNLPEMPSFPKGEPRFIELLKKHEVFHPRWDGVPSAGTDEIDARAGLVLHSDFPDSEGLLETVCADFTRFLAEGGIAGSAFPVILRHAPGFEWESYRLDISSDAIVLEASDTEGIRRGLYHLEDCIASSPLLKRGVRTRTPWLRNRISRCFFGPIKRPPFNVDELMNDIDYYPEEYLNALARHGINGLWLTIAFREICDTDIRPAIPQASQRLAKLRATVEKCRRYGIKIWCFCIEPIFWSLSNDNPVPEGFEELLGPGYSAEEAGVAMNSFCPNSETAQKYLYQCTHSLFSAVPHLGGILSISHGERMTSCLSRINAHSDGNIPCKRRCDKTIGQILAMTLGPMKQGMKDANPHAELISWLYMPYVDQVGNWITQMPSELKGDVALAFNFESGVNKYQLGKVRTGGDYWLSETGPSDRFVIMSQAAKGHCDMAAKLQVSCSHECATVPYIPAPGLLYRKYRQMRKLGVRHVIQCWYFGNYPGTMNEAAGQLAYEDFQTSEDDFLMALAGHSWGSDASHIVQAWKHFADGYSNYPLDILFQYYGPIHDGVVWPLHLQQVTLPLTRSWKPDAFPAGDGIGECMVHFQLPELVELTRRISQNWHQGMKCLEQVPKQFHELNFTLAEALDILFRSGHNILQFYAIRNALMEGAGDEKPLLQTLADIVREEMAASLRMAELCQQDARLGYHSEAEVYKFFPEKLRWRAQCLQQLLDTELPQAQLCLETPGKLAEWLRNAPDAIHTNTWNGENGIRWMLNADGTTLHFRIALEGALDGAEQVFLLLSDQRAEQHPVEAILVLRGKQGTDPQITQRETDTGWEIQADIPRSALNYKPRFLFGVQRAIFSTGKPPRLTNDKPGNYLEPRLCLGYHDPRKLSLVSLEQ